MPGIPLPENEAERLAKLRGYQILDSLPEAAYDRITRLASKILDTPIALVSLVDAERQWFKARVGLDATETPRDISFCTHAICQDEVFVVEDATSDARFCDNPLVTGDPAIRFYAGAPLRTGDGIRMGTLCAIDTKPRRISAAEKQMLADLAAVIVEALEMRQLVSRAERAENRLIDAVDSLPNGFVLYDHEDRLVLCNKQYREIYADSADLIVPGASFSEIIRKGVERGQYPDAVGREEAWIAERLEAHNNPGDPIEQHLSGDRWLRVQERRTSEGGLVGFRIDITKLKHQERELARLAWTDCLTGALNRHRFMELAEREMDRARRHNIELSLLMLDADHFKAINDRDGHAAGDAVLIGLVERWTKVLRSHDLIGRIGGEEFCVMLPEVGRDGAVRAAERLRQSVAELPFACGGQLIRATVSIGVAVHNPDTDDLMSLMNRADKSLYEAKETGRDRFVISAA